MKEVVLIGLGKIGMGYDLSSSGILFNQTMTHLKALCDSDLYSVCGVMDTENSNLILARETYSVRTVSNLNEILPTKKIDLLTIATSTQTHLEILESLPENLIPKILLIEKPAGASSQECVQIAQWANSNSTLVFVNYFRRYLSKVKEARVFVSGLNLGKLLSVSINSYGSLLNIFSHFMDLGLTVTSKNLFCSCPKSTYMEAAPNLLLECTKCGVRYSFFGVGQSRVTSQLRICFENYQIDIDDDGMKILISEISGDGLVCFETSEDVYKNYQEIVYSAIGTFSKDTHFLSGMNQAIDVHRFIESTRVSDGK
jgi:hypothetical protein